MNESFSSLAGGSGFFFQRRSGKLNWRRVADMDLKRLVAEVDVDSLQEHVENITFADVTEEGTLIYPY
jgi:zinc finger protein DZIP1